MKVNVWKTVSVIVLTIIFLSGCNWDLGKFNEYQDVFYGVVKDVIPAFPSSAGTSSSTTTRALATDWNWGNPVYEIYSMLEDNIESDAYINIYAMLAGADAHFNALSSSGTVIGDTVVLSPVDLGFNDDGDVSNNTYNTYYTSAASDMVSQSFGRVDGTMLYMLHTEQAATEKCLLQGTYDGTTSDVFLAVFLANYVESRWETVWAEIEGNTETHAFSIRMLRDNTGTAYRSNMVGCGISQGTDSYFLFKMANETMDMASAVYYQFDAVDPGATAADILAALQAIDINGTAVPSGDTANYAASLPVAYSETGFDAYDEVTELQALSVTIDDSAF